ncbi:alkaline phosphatase family protein [Burkholderiaceae bacterium FT117]|uniref:alkaline phosphatase family protein n=1 Tax=Zeimonas sediminis TaxID=2944268 RepID=UPI002342E20A|nr:alkaline phosphatase family protein [Zeimonas sediminis]MCM5571719.1 alkaline phosphatase family protein [Zeimonas sediminis]
MAGLTQSRENGHPPATPVMKELSDIVTDPEMQKKGSRVMAIGLDGADPVLVEKWIAEGRLPNLARMQAEGAYGRLRSTVELHGQRMEAFSTEPLWVEFATGCKPTKTGAWDSMEYFPDRYQIRNLDEGSPAFDDFDPFYALGESKKVAVLDVPMARLSDRVKGLQVLGWGGHFPHTESRSLPDGLLGEIVARHGRNPVLHNDTGIWWDRRYVKWLDEALAESVDARVGVCEDLLARDEWDLFLAVFSETHSAGHDVYCYSQPDHPLNAPLTGGEGAGDPLRKVYEDVDRAIGKLMAAAPADAFFVCFSLHGMGPNYSDLLSSVVLSETLYRWCFPGSIALGPGKEGSPPGEILTSARRDSWVGELWSRYNNAPWPIRFVRSCLPGRLLKASFNGLASPFSGEAQANAMLWHPSMWYRPLWPRMKAFALPGFTKGRIRINLQGRDRDGIVAPGEYHRVCDEVTRILRRLTDGRSGRPLVKEVYRTRADDLGDLPGLPAFDLDVLWEEHITDVVDSPDIGRIGPVPHFRAGGHWNRGFVAATGRGIPAGMRLPESEAADLAATILRMMDHPLPGHYDGRPLFDTRPPG